MKSKVSEGVKEHIEKYWQLSIEFFERDDFPLAAFFAITLIEEVAKLSILRVEFTGGNIEDTVFYNHKKKYLLAVYDNLFVNSRVARIYGKDEGRFMQWLKGDTLFKIRNQALYLGKDMKFPKTQVARDDSFLIVCLAGEIYAEIQGYSTNSNPKEWDRIISEVDSFRLSFTKD